MSPRENLNSRFNLQFSFDTGISDWVPIVPATLMSSQSRPNQVGFGKAATSKQSSSPAPGTRPDRVALARRLLADPSYPSREILVAVSRHLAISLLGDSD
jgi:hypothetical protein